MKHNIISGLLLCFCFLSNANAQEGCEVKGLILNEYKESIEHVLIISFDSTSYEKNKLDSLKQIRSAFLTKSDSLNRYSMGVTQAKGEFRFVMGSSKYAIIYHPDYQMKIIDRYKLENPCKFELITLIKND